MAEPQPEDVPIGVGWKLVRELGTFGVVSHRLQHSRDSTYFDLRRDGNQDTMFFFGRISTELELDDHHEIVFDRVKPFVTLRYLGGAAVGGSDSEGPGDGFNRNWLHTMSRTLGAEVTFGVVASDRAARNREVTARKARRRARRGR